jgi:hypothetical protein
MNRRGLAKGPRISGAVIRHVGCRVFGLSDSPDRKTRKTMIAFWLYVASLLPTPTPTPAHTRGCEEYGPRLDGTYVTVCSGSVVRVRDGLGNSREWDRTSNTVTARSAGQAPVVLR